MPVIPFAATVGTWMGASAATAAAVGGTTIATLAAAGAAAGMSMSASSKASKQLSIQQPEVPKMEDTKEQVQAQSTAKKAAAARNKTIYSSPMGKLGTQEETNIVKSTLLGR